MSVTVLDSSKLTALQTVEAGVKLLAIKPDGSFAAISADLQMLTRPSVADLDNAELPGVYSPSNEAANLPVKSWGRLLVLKHQSDTIQQLFFPLLTQSQIYYRYKSSSSGWQPWVKLTEQGTILTT